MDKLCCIPDGVAGADWVWESVQCAEMGYVEDVAVENGKKEKDGEDAWSLSFSHGRCNDAALLEAVIVAGARVHQLWNQTENEINGRVLLLLLHRFLKQMGKSEREGKRGHESGCD